MSRYKSFVQRSSLCRLQHEQFRRFGLKSLQLEILAEVPDASMAARTVNMQTGFVFFVLFSAHFYCVGLQNQEHFLFPLSAKTQRQAHLHAWLWSFPLQPFSSKGSEQGWYQLRVGSLDKYNSGDYYYYLILLLL